MIRYMKWIGLGAALLLVISCFTPWVIIASKNITISGIDATGTKYGKPGYFNLLMTAFFLFFHFIPRVWAKRANLIVGALNLAWTLRNYFVLTFCMAGECPEKQTGLYLVTIAAIVMMIAALFPSMELPQQKKD
ncbi:MAG TPA: hypothetical protein VF487_16785 [Chitinophagaceae bacterium]